MGCGKWVTFRGNLGPVTSSPTTNGRLFRPIQREWADEVGIQRELWKERQ